MIENIFPVKIYKTNYGQNLKSLKQKILPVLSTLHEKVANQNQASMRNGGICSYNAVRNLHRLPEFAELVQFINHHVVVYWGELGYMAKRKPQVLEMWANIYPHSSYIESHDHSPMPVVCSFYLQKTAGAGNLCFENPMEVLLKHQPIENIYQADRSGHDTLLDHQVCVNEGDLILFPGYLKHYTQPNKDTTDRIIIGAMLDQSYRTRTNAR